MSKQIIARTNSVLAVKFHQLPYRSEIGLNSGCLFLNLGYPISETPNSAGEPLAASDTYQIDLFTRRGEAYSVLLTKIADYAGDDTWNFYGADEAFYTFCQWYTSVGGRARLAYQRVAS